MGTLMKLVSNSSAEFFQDDRDRTILLIETEKGMEARFQGEPIGWLEVERAHLPFKAGISNTVYLLKHIEVSLDNQRLGIGYELLATAKEWFAPLHIPETGSPAYLALLERANRKGLLLKKWPKEHHNVEKLRINRGDLDW